MALVQVEINALFFRVLVERVTELHSVSLNTAFPYANGELGCCMVQSEAFAIISTH
jgi:hypothetical protein